MDEQLFSPQPQPAPAQPAGPSVPQLTSIAARLKLAEERYANLQKRNQLTEDSLLSFEQDIRTELRVLTQQTVELRKHLAQMNAKIDAMAGELGQVVQKPDFAVLERYLDLWQPMQFITREEARRLIADAKKNDAGEKDA